MTCHSGGDGGRGAHGGVDLGGGRRTYKHVGDGDAVWIGYGGYSVQTDWSCAWSEELHRTRLRALGVGHLYAVKGPNDPGYRNREVANTALGAHLTAGPGPDAPFVLVAAHSSGTYVAHELFGQLKDRGAATSALRKKIVYANGCHSGAKWCLHDLVITTRPHDPATFDLRQDYTDFANRPVQTAWIDALSGSLR